MGARNEFGSTVSLTNLLTVSQLGCEQKKLLGFGGLCRAPLTLNFSRAVWVTPPVRVYGRGARSVCRLRREAATAARDGQTFELLHRGRPPRGSWVTSRPAQRVRPRVEVVGLARRPNV